ncbi:MAG: leucine-rich repeat domain-containing protein [Salinivirgaceae bacterium]|nr:leucine-rich repeat domain-containing protein [Salinivirgaceae bacterium]
MKQLFSIAIAAMLAGQALAQTTFTVGNLEYTVIDAEEHMVSVSAASSKPTGALTIESIVANGNASYLVTEIGAYGFENCSGLTSLVLPESLTTIGQFAFNGCTGLTSITLPESLTTIKNNAFVNCQKVASFEIPNSVTTIGGYAFYNCYALTALTIPRSATSVGAGLCSFCTKLTAITVEDGNPNYVSVDGVLYTIYTTQLVQYPIGKNSSSFVFPNTVTTIARSSFRGCTKLQNVTLSESLTSVAGYAFNKCSNLKTINIPSSVTCIDDHTFDGCHNLKVIAIPATVATIKEGAFSSCSNLTVYCEAETKPTGWSGDWSANSAVYGVMPGGEYIVRKTNDSEHTAEIVVYIGTSTSISIPETLEINGTSYSVTGIGDNAFKGSTSLTSITVPATVTEISGSAFSGCSAAINIEGDNFTYEDNILFNKDKTVIICCLNPLTGTYEIPSTVKRISTFNAGSGLTSLTIPSTVETIDSAAFVGATGLTTITTSSQLDFRKALLRFVKDDIKYQVLAKDSVMVVANIYTGTVLIPPFVNAGNNFLVTTIGEDAFYNNRGITSVTLPNTITKIPKSAFYSCTKLKAIALGNAVKSIETGAFKYCSLESLDIPKSVVEVGVESFAYNNLTTITTESDADFSLSGLSIIKDNIKYEILDKTSVRVVANNYTGAVEIPASIAAGNTFTVTKIADKAFQNATALTSVTIPESVTQIGQYAFYYCKELTSITIPNGVTKIEHGVFAQCYGLTTLTIPETVTSIAENAFEHCTGLKSIVIPKSVTTIGSYAFNGCNNVETLSYNTAAIGTQFGGSAMLKTIIIGDSIKSISNYAFRNCKALTTISFSDSVKSIGYSAFEGCIGLTSLTIPKSTTYIDQCAFRSCSGLNRVFIPNSVTDMRYGVFDDCTSATIYCEAESEPNGWGIWNPDNLPVVWNSKGDSYSDEFFTFEITDANRYTAKITGYTGTNANVVIPQKTTIGGVEYSVTTVGSQVFYGNKTFRSVFIPYYIDTVEALAFGDNHYDARIFCEAAGDESTVPDCWAANWYGLSSLAVEYNAHINDGFVYQITDNSNRKAQIIRYMGSKDTLAVPDKINGGMYTVNSIAGYAFYDCDNIKTLDIPSSVTEIGNYAFYGSDNIETLTFNTNAIGSNFQNRSSLKKVRMGNNVTSIADWAFSHTGLEEVIFSESVKTVGSSAFDGCSNLRKADFASIASLCGIEFEGSNPLSSAHHLYIGGEEVTRFAIPDNVASIGARAFSGCSYIDSVFIPATVTNIGTYAFYGCSNLTIYCDVVSKPGGWNESWNPSYCRVVWKPLVWNVAVSANNSAYGNVSGGGTVANDSTTTITATPAANCHFVRWSNGSTNATETITVTSDTTIVAEFESDVQMWAVTVSANNNAYGNVSGGGLVADGSTATITATPKTGYKFVKWSNGSTKATETITVTSDLSLTAEFAEIQIIPENNQEIPENPIAETPADSTSFSFSILSSSDHTVEVSGYRGTSSNAVIPSKTIIDGEEYTVTAIGDQSFRNNSTIVSVTIPNTVTNIKSNAFRCCVNLEYVVIPSSVTTIGEGPFGERNKLTAIYVDSENTHFVSYDGVLYSADMKKLVQYPCSKPNSVFEIPNTVERIEYLAFSSCPNLISLVLPNSLKTIKWWAVAACGSLQSLVIPNSVTSIEGNGIRNCKNLTIYCEAESKPSGWSSSWNSDSNPVVWGYSSSQEDFKFTITSTSDKTIEVSGYTGTNAIVIIPKKAIIDGVEYTVTGIGAYSLQSCSGITSITIPNTVTTISNNAFGNCTSLASISIPNSVTTIGGYAFYNCKRLTSLTIPKSVTSIGYGLCSFCEDLAKIVVESGNASYVAVDGVLYNIDKTQLVMYPVGKDARLFDFPETVTSTTRSAFRGCTNLDSVTFNDKLTTIGGYTFNGCYNLSGVFIKKTVTTIGDNAFMGCSNLTIYCEADSQPEGWDSSWNSSGCPVVWGSSSGNNGENNNQEFNPEDFTYGIISFSKMTVEIDGYNGTSSNVVIPSTVVLGGDEFTIVSIADETFKDCDNLVSVTLPNTITSIGDDAFRNCSNLESVSLPNTIESIGACTFAECGSLTTIEIPNSVTFIGNSAFAESGLTSVVIPNSVTEISSYAFRDCADLASVEIPNSVATVGMCAFENCSELGTVKIPSSVSSIGIKAFDGCDNATFECEVEAKPEGWDEWWNYNNRPVVWKNDSPGTAVAESAAAAVNIYAHGNTIVVENADDEIFVYDAMGKLVYRNTASTVSAEIRINGTGIYVVRVGNTAKRVMVKD